jgi:hypothetical protein
MKKRIADWIWMFWYNNHTHFWIKFEPTMKRDKCSRCGIIKPSNYG